MNFKITISARTGFSYHGTLLPLQLDNMIKCEPPRKLWQNDKRLKAMALHRGEVLKYKPEDQKRANKRRWGLRLKFEDGDTEI